MPVELTVAERLILRNQYLILKKLHPDEAEYYEKVITIVEDGYEHDYGQLVLSFDKMPAQESAEVIDILGMYDALQTSRKKLARQSTEIAEDKVEFPGFDGNNETESRYMGYARFLVTDRRFADVKSWSTDFNSHMEWLPKYRAMLRTWKAFKRGAEPGQSHAMTVDQIRQVLGSND